MSAADFAAWAIPDLTISLPGSDGVSRKYAVHPPSVDDTKKLLACAVRGEVMLGILPGAVIPDAIQEVLDTVSPDEHPALGAAYDQMVADGVHPLTIDRASYYSVFYWTRGKEYADGLAVILWAREEADAEQVGETAPKG